MDWIHVSSRNINAIAYEPNSLYVMFHGNRIYQYHDVPEHVYDEFLNVDSYGTYLDRFIKGTYRFTRLD